MVTVNLAWSDLLSFVTGTSDTFSSVSGCPGPCLARIRSFVFKVPPCQDRAEPWASCRMASLMVGGANKTTMSGSPVRRSLWYKILLPRKLSFWYSLQKRKSSKLYCGKVLEYNRFFKACSLGSNICSSRILSSSNEMLSTTMFLDRKLAGISLPFLYTVSNSKVSMASCNRFKVLVCTFPSFSKGQWPVNSVSVVCKGEYRSVP